MTDNIVDLADIRPISSLEFDTLYDLAEGMEGVARALRNSADSGEVVENFAHLKLILAVDFGQRRFVVRKEPSE